MKLTLERIAQLPDCTIGRLTIDEPVIATSNNVFYTMEPIDRGLSSNLSLNVIQHTKVYGKTAIPTGIYELKYKLSNKLQYHVYELQDVPGFADVYMHIGNFPKDTEGCILLGMDINKDQLLSSRMAFNNLMAILMAVNTQHEIEVK